MLLVRISEKFELMGVRVTSFYQMKEKILDPLSNLVKGATDVSNLFWTLPWLSRTVLSVVV